MISRNFTSVLLGIVMLTGLFAAACGDDGESLESHVLTCKLAGYYVLGTTPEAERQQLRVGVFGLKDGTTQWLEVSSSGIGLYAGDQSVWVAEIPLTEEPDDSITTRTETNGAEYYLLELHAYLDINANAAWDAGEPFVDGKNQYEYTSTESQSWVYFFKETTTRAQWGYNYKLGTSYYSTFEDLDPIQASPVFIITTYQVRGGK